MAWTAPVTFVGGQVPTAANLNAQIRDNLLESMPAKATTNGSLFVSTGVNQITERFVDMARVNTTQSTSSTSFTNLATTGPAVTLNTGAKVLVFWGAQMYNSLDNGASFMAYKVTGASTRQAWDSESVYQGGTPNNQEASGGMIHYVQTLTPGVNTFTAQYRASTGTSSFGERFIAVIPLS